MDEIKQLQTYIANSKRIVFFGGAGVSTESGIPDFRSPDGLYHQKYKYPPEEILSYSFFTAYPDEFYRFYRDKVLFLTAKPNAAHKKLAELERAGRLAAVITQNIDGLHQAAGAKNVLELHGSVWRNYCMSCGKTYGVEVVAAGGGVPRCGCGGIIRPDVILYEEPLNSDIMGRAEACLRQADLLIVGGTSLSVYPAAGLLAFYRGPLALINRSATPHDHRASLLIKENIGKVLEQIEVR
jgi:NAD-dependent deacetylase